MAAPDGRQLVGDQARERRSAPLSGAPVLLTAGVLGWLIGAGVSRSDRRAVGGGETTPAPAATSGPADGSTPTGQTQTPAQEDGESPVERWVRLGTSVIAPTTVLTALLFYFGYVATTAEYRYFGLTLGTLGLSTQDVVLRSIAALYVPLGALLVLLLLMSWLHHTVSGWVATGAHTTLLRRAAVALVVLGAIGFARGVVGVVVPDVARTEPVAFSPLCLGLGAVAVAYGRSVLHRTSGTRAETRDTIWAGRAALAFTAGLVTLSLFWATNSFAGAYGRGRAMDVAARLTDRPAVVLDTTERLFAAYPGVQENPLPTEEGQELRYRYYGFRLLVQAEERMFLLPERWRVEDGTTLVVRLDDDVRVLLYR